MKNRIVNIETYPYHSGIINFAGTLRNEKKFELFQDVFILYNGKMHRCKIVGIVLPPIDNPDYIYTVEIPKELVDKDNERVSYQCDKIFSTLEEAKRSALKANRIKYELNRDNILKFFEEQ